MYQELYNLCLSFLVNELSAIRRIEAYQEAIDIVEGSLVFSLSSLYDFLSQSTKEQVTYKEFQRQLYQSTLNQDLKAHGGQVVVHHSTGKVETNLYRLERIPSADNIL